MVTFDIEEEIYQSLEKFAEGAGISKREAMNVLLAEALKKEEN